MNLGKMSKFLAIISGALEALTAIWSYGGALYFALMAAKYVFTGTVIKNFDLTLVGICMLFGVMLFYTKRNK